jgi:hypothetical protein
MSFDPHVAEKIPITDISKILGVSKQDRKKVQFSNFHQMKIEQLF